MKNNWIVWSFEEGLNIPKTGKGIADSTGGKQEDSI